MADRVRWMLENNPPEDFHLAVDILDRAGLFGGDRPLKPKELLDKTRWGIFQERLVLLGVDFPTTGRMESPAWLQEVGPIAWAGSLLENEPADEMP